MHDVFGRERHRENREDMSGVGSFSKDQRTLYVQLVWLVVSTHTQTFAGTFLVCGM